MKIVDISNYTFPFRVGRKTKRAILDANGIEVIVFPNGHEHMADLTMKLYNAWFKDLKKQWAKYPDCD